MLFADGGPQHAFSPKMHCIWHTKRTYAAVMASEHKKADACGSTDILPVEGSCRQTSEKYPTSHPSTSKITLVFTLN